MVVLRKLCEKDADGMLSWMYNPQVQKGFRKDMSTNTQETVRSFIANACYEKKQGGAIHFAVIDDSDEYMGTMTLKEIDVANNNAEVAYVICPENQGRGLGETGLKLLCQKAFEEYDFERLSLEAYTDNPASNRLAIKCGFMLEGVRRHCLYINNEYKDLNCYSIIKEDYIRTQRS